MRATRALAWLLLLGWGCTLACAPATPTAPPAAAPVQTSPAASEPDSEPDKAPAPLPAAQPAPAPVTLKGDEELPEAWRSAFRGWLSAQTDRPYIAVTGSMVMSNAVSILLLRHSETNGVCLEGPSKLDLMEPDKGSSQLSVELEHFGDDCCPDTECTRTPDGWNLRYLSLLAAKNWQALSLLVPAKKKLVSSVNGETPTKLTRKQVASGGFSDAPSCGLMYNVTGCSEVDEKTASFTCRCDGGGYHVAYAWEREGNGFVLVETSESSH